MSESEANERGNSLIGRRSYYRLGALLLRKARNCGSGKIKGARNCGVMCEWQNEDAQSDLVVSLLHVGCGVRR